MARQLTRIYKDNKGSEAASSEAQNSNDGVASEVAPVSQDVATESSVETQNKNVSSTQPIHWLGSSYSGADIKVVAHLYQEISHEDRIAELTEQKAISEDIAGGCDKLLSGGILDYFQFHREADETFTQQEMITAWLELAEVNENTHEKAKFELTRLWHAWVTYAINLNEPTTANDKLSEQYDFHTSFAEALQDQIENLKEIQANASTTLTLGTLQTISVQSHREKVGVRALGKSYVKGYTRGPRTIGGSMIFTVFDEHALKRLLRSITSTSYYGDTYSIGENYSSYLPDQLPPIDLSIVFANEYGSFSRMTIYGVEFVNDGVTMSIEDLLTEQVCNFVARDVDVMTSLGNKRLSQFEKGMFFSTGGREDISATDLMFTSARTYNEYLIQLGLRRGRSGW